MKHEYVQNIYNKGGKSIAEMHIYTYIGKGGINANDFVNELKSLKVDRLNVRINTVGGNVIDGFGIFSAMLNFKEKGGDLHTYNDGLAASTGGWLLLAADPKNIHSKDYAILMLHGVKNDVKGGIFEKSIINIFKNRSGIDVKSLMTNGMDNFFDAQEAAENGFFPAANIENTGLEIDIPENMDLYGISNVIQNINKNNNPKPLKMEKVINLLSLQQGSSEEVVAQAVQNALKKANDNADALLIAENKITEKDATILELQGKVTAANTAAATALVENAIKEGKFAPKDETAKNELVNQAVANPDGFKSMVAMMPTKSANVLNELGGDDSDVKNLLEKVNNRSLRELEKEDPALLNQIKNEAKGEFVNLWNKQYGTNKTEADFK